MMNCTSSNATRGVLLAALAVGLSTCVIDSVPIPDGQPKQEPTAGASDNAAPAVDFAMVLYSTDPVVLVGLPKAVPGLGELVIENPARNGWLARIITHGDGSFVAPVNAAVGEQVLLSFAGRPRQPLLLAATSSEAAEASATFAAAGGAPSTPGSAYANVQAGAPNAAGLVAVSAPATTLALGLTLVVMDLARSTFASAVAAPDGSFSMTLAAEAGDELAFFVVRDGTANGGRVFRIVVP